MIYSVTLLVCFFANPCNEQRAALNISGMFVNGSDSKTPCEDWLLAQLAYNSALNRDREQSEMTIIFECRQRKS